MAIAAFLRSGAYDQFLARTRRTYRELVASGREAVARAFPPGARMTRPAGGFVLWIEMPADRDAIRLGEAARVAGISIIARGSMFSVGGGYGNCMRLSSGQPWTPRTETAFETLGRLARHPSTRRS